jgi:hypothetical protein
LLDNFNSKIASYDGWAINIYHEHETITAAGQAASMCIYRSRRAKDDEDPGMQCCLSAAVDRDSTDTYRTYWFDADVVDSIVSAASAGTLDLIDADYDDYIIDTDYEGMDHFDMRRTGSNGFEADKF